MIYNLSPIVSLLKEDTPNAATWKSRIEYFFNNEEYDPVLQDQYYDILLSGIPAVEFCFNTTPVIDDYTGLFSFPSEYIQGSHSFNIALFISQHYQHFFKKKILTVCADFGMLNIQMKLSGLNIVSAVQSEFYNIGSVMACIGNNAPPYPINLFEFPEEDVLFMSCVFQDEDLAYKNLEMMIDKRLAGKEVFFTTNTFSHLRNYLNYDMIEPIIDPKDVYHEEDYGNIPMGYMNKIYRFK